jgi:hypothetical protein
MSLIPTQSEAATNQQLASRFFTLVGDMMAGTDAEPRMEPGMTGGVLLGPGQQAYDFGFGVDGQVYQRGQPGSTTGAAPATPTLFGVPAKTLALLLIAAGGVYLLLRK